MTKRRFIDLDPGKPVHFREWRAYRGMTQEQVQQLLEWGPGRVSKLESGASSWSGEVLAALARVYACEPTELFELPPEIPQPFAQSGTGIGGIIEMHRQIIRLQAEIGDLKNAFMPRLQGLEERLAQTAAVAEVAVKDAEELVGLFARFASQLPAKKPKPRRTKSSPSKFSA